MTLEDGIYEVRDLFYENAGYTLAVVGGEPDFAEGTGPVTRLRLEVLYPGLDFSKPANAPSGVTRERCEFMKSAIKSTLASSTSGGKTAELVNKALKTFTGGSMFESTFVMHVLLSGGLNYMVQKNGAPQGVSVIDGKCKIGILMARTIMACPDYIGFRRSIQRKANRGDLKDIKFHSMLVKAPHNLKNDYFWTKEDAEECLAILKANPFLREYLPGNAV